MNSINNTNVVDFLNVMNSDVPRNEGSEDDSLAFAFNDSNISDRIIQLEVMNNLIEVHPNVEGCSIKDIEKDHGNIGDEATYANDGNHQMNCSEIIRVKTLHVISSILAAKSPFFYTLFSNEMMESEQKHVTLRIVASEEAPFIKLLNFMYTNSLIVFSPPILLDILMVADKFKVESCMRYCIRVLMNIPMTPETALLYLELPSSVLMVDFVLPLIDSAKQYLAHRYKDIIKHEQELMRFPFAGMEALLSSDDLLVASEDVVYDFVLKWAKTRYPKLEERREVLGMKLASLIRFPFMSCRKLKTVQTSNDFDREVATQLVSDALYFKAEAPRQQQILAAESASTSRLFVERSYKFRPVKVVEFELPCQQCMVYLDLKQEECANLFPCGRVYSVPFRLCGQRYFLKANCRMDQQSYYHSFGLFLGMQERSSSYEIDYEFAARSKPTEEYISRFKGSYVFTRGMVVGHKNLFATPWTSFMAEDSPFFINGILHLRVELTIRNSLN